jgi:fructose-specific phosphotransferase system IIC component
MFHIPSFDRLLPRKLPSSYGRRDSLAEQLWTLGAIPVMIGCTVLAGFEAGRFWAWLAIPAGFLGLSLSYSLLFETVIIGGVLRAIFYSAAIYVFSDGFYRFDTAPLVAAMIVGFLLLWATYLRWRRRDK